MDWHSAQGLECGIHLSFFRPGISTHVSIWQAGAGIDGILPRKRNTAVTLVLEGAESWSWMERWRPGVGKIKFPKVSHENIRTCMPPTFDKARGELAVLLHFELESAMKNPFMY